jgi:hypothetical protein
MELTTDGSVVEQVIKKVKQLQQQQKTNEEDKDKGELTANFPETRSEEDEDLGEEDLDEEK